MSGPKPLIEREQTLSDGTRIELFAIENPAYPGGINYRFAYFDPEAGENILRYDNSRAPRHDIGVHHRHEGDKEPTSIPFKTLDDHLSRFQTEVRRLHDERN